MAQEPYQIFKEPRLDDLTNIYNPTDEDFTWQFGGIDYTVKAKESRLLPRHLCQHIAKHLTDKILQEKYNVPNTLADTPIRRKVLSEILVDESKEKNIDVSEKEAEESVASEQKKAAAMAQTENDPFHKKNAKIPPPKL